MGVVSERFLGVIANAPKDHGHAANLRPASAEDCRGRLDASF